MSFACAASLHPRKKIFSLFATRCAWQDFHTSSTTQILVKAARPKVAAALAGPAFPVRENVLIAPSRVLTFSSTSGGEDKGAPTSPFTSSVRAVRSKRPRRKLIPKKYAVTLTPKTRSVFKSLLEGAPDDVIGILFKYGQSTGSLGMAFSFGFARESEIGVDDEGVSLETLPSGEPKPPVDAQDDGLPKLYVSSDALLKVLGCTIDIDKDGISPLVLDAEGNRLDPNA